MGIKDKLSRSLLAPEDGYLSYYDIKLTKADVDSIKNDWLTDNVIDFWEEYLQREELIKYPEAKIVLLQCTVSYLIMSTPDDQLEGIVFNLPRLRDATHIFMPVNDNPDPAKGGGSHWSLLLVSRIDGVAFHYDSMFPSNSDFAHRTSRKLELLLGKQLRFVDMNDAPQQSNGSDCGVYVCLNMRHLLLERLLRVDARSKIAMTMRTDDVNSTAGRKEMLRLVEEIRRKAERQRSRSKSPRPSTDSKSPPRIGPPSGSEAHADSSEER